MNSTQSSNTAIALWLTLVAALVFAMVVVGGVTRLTRSGLSITEWNPVIGAIPPLSAEQWQAEFEKYRETPEYRHVNAGMSLDGFKRIYWVEWAHRLLGRLIGFAVILPLIYFAVRRQLSKPLVGKLIALFILGGLQGALGWFMVKSGLVDIPRVSPYRLTAHLGLAVGLYAWLVWIVLDLKRPLVRERHPRARRYALVITGLVVLMILAGGFVAGTRAGFAFNTFPLMNGAFFPPGLYAMRPAWANIFENIATVQFNHRLLAYVLLISTAAFWWWGRRANLAIRTQRITSWLFAVLCAQVVLGIATLLFIVPVWLGALHQAGALAVLTIVLRLNHDLAKSR